MSTTIMGIVTNGVVVPSSPLPDGARVGIHLSWISKKPDRCGGEACVRDSRITVWGLVANRRLGMSDSEIMQTIQGLTPADLETAWEYAAVNATEIDEAIRVNEAGDEGFVE